jgi:AraC family transcriptional regulator
MLGTRGDFETAAAPEREVAPIIAQLLQRACLALDRDAHAARREIHRALVLLEHGAPRTEGPPGPAERPRLALAPWQARRVIDHIQANVERPIAVEDLAAVTRLSTSYFFRAFKRSFGVSPHAYVVSLRLARARELMVRTDEQMSQIAAACGFADQSHFSRVFRREVGCAPGLWRREQSARVVPDCEPIAPALPI